MTFLELSGLYVFPSCLLGMVALAAWFVRVGARLDDADRRRLIALHEAASAAYLFAEREAMEWDYVFSLPAVEHP